MTSDPPHFGFQDFVKTTRPISIILVPLESWGPTGSFDMSWFHPNSWQFSSEVISQRKGGFCDQMYKRFIMEISIFFVGSEILPRWCTNTGNTETKCYEHFRTKARSCTSSLKREPEHLRATYQHPLAQRHLPLCYPLPIWGKYTQGRTNHQIRHFEGISQGKTTHSNLRSGGSITPNLPCVANWETNCRE